MKLKLLVILLMLFSHSLIKAQLDSISYEDQDEELKTILDFLKNMPPLEELIEQAMLYSPRLKQATYAIQIQKTNLKIMRHDFFNNINLPVMVGYGNFNPGGGGALTSASDFLPSVQGTYGVFLRLDLNPNYFINRKNRKTQSLLKLQDSEAELEYQIFNLKNIIGFAYLQLVQSKKIFYLTARQMETERSGFYFTKKRFFDGDIDFFAYNAACLSELKRKENLIFASTTLKESYYALNQLVGGTLP
jgi:outer membrane protein TolC